jgi:hypothetical protein
MTELCTCECTERFVEYTGGWHFDGLMVWDDITDTLICANCFLPVEAPAPDDDEIPF